MDALGRGVIVLPGQEAPDGWAAAARVAIDDTVMRDPAGVADVLHAHWACRQPVVVEVGVDADELRAAEVETAAPYSLAPGFEFARERLYFVARSNNYDSRSGRLVWGPAIEARRLGAGETAEGDVVLPDGRVAWCDGGPRAGSIDVPDGHVLVHRVRLDEGSLEPDRAAPPGGALAPDQERAVGHDAGPARIVAPAGSGKTRVLTERYRLLVTGRGWGARSVGAVAYNVRAKDEMQSRLTDVGDAARRKVRTLHSLGYEILRRGGRGSDVIDEREIRRRIDGMVPVRHRANTDVYAPYLEALSEVRLGLVAPDIVESKRDDVDGFAEMFARYRDGLVADRVVDHDEQIYGALEVLLRRPDVRRELQRECRHLLVDEFQDLTPAQLLMLRLVAAPAYDVFGVGDDDQVIYGYAGADPDFLIRYDHYFPGATGHDLEVNYRCPPAVVDGARNLLSYNRRRVEKEIHAHRTEPLDPSGVGAVHVEPGAPDELARIAVAHISEWIEGGANPSEIAVLARVNAALLPVQVMCVDAGIPCWLPVNASVLDRSGSKAALAYLRLANALAAGVRMDGRDIAIAARRPPRSLPPNVLDRIQKRTWTLTALRALDANLNSRAADRYDEFLDALAKLATSGDTAALLRCVRDEVGLGGALEALDRSGRGPDASHADDLNALIAVAPLRPDPVEFEPWLRSRLPASGRSIPAGDAVALSTVHRVKGMEWPHVVVFGAHDGLMPHALADDIEEERRIFHVAITRCSHDVRILVQAGRRTPFVDQLAAPAPPPEPEAVAAPAPAAPVRPGTTMVADLGLELSYAGSTGPIVELRADVAVIEEPAGARLLVPYDERVEIDGRRYRLLAPEVPLGDVDDDLVTALKSWRRDRAKSDGVPAYVVLHDSHITEIARRAPRTLRELADCPGIGPTKLDRYGDEIIAVVEAAADA